MEMEENTRELCLTELKTFSTSLQHFIENVESNNIEEAVVKKITKLINTLSEQMEDPDSIETDTPDSEEVSSNEPNSNEVSPSTSPEDIYEETEEEVSKRCSNCNYFTVETKKVNDTLLLYKYCSTCATDLGKKIWPPKDWKEEGDSSDEDSDEDDDEEDDSDEDLYSEGLSFRSDISKLFEKPKEHEVNLNDPRLNNFVKGEFKTDKVLLYKKNNHMDRFNNFNKFCKVY